MEINNFIKVYDDLLTTPTLDSLLKYSKNKAVYTQGEIVENDGISLNTNIRKTQVHALNNNSLSLSNVHWGNLLSTVFLRLVNNYIRNFDCPIKGIIDVSILKYEDCGFYDWHTDHCPAIPRTLSLILMINDDYEGGSLCFKHPDNTNQEEILPKANRVIIWPSNFIYPHTVKPVTKGTRYSVVAWAL